MGARGERGAGIAHGDRAGGGDKISPGMRRDGIEVCRFELVPHLYGSSRPPRRLRRAGEDKSNRLPHKMHLAVGQERLILNDAPHLVLAGDIPRGEYGKDSGHRLCLSHFDALQPGMSHLTADQGAMKKQGRLVEIIDKPRLAGEMEIHFVNFHGSVPSPNGHRGRKARQNELSPAGQRDGAYRRRCHAHR